MLRTSNRAAPGRTAGTVQQRACGRGPAIASGSGEAISSPHLHGDELAHEESDHDGSDSQENPAAGRSLPEMELLKADRVEVEGRRVRHRTRPASGHHEDGVEQL